MNIYECTLGDAVLAVHITAGNPFSWDGRFLMRQSGVMAVDLRDGSFVAVPPDAKVLTILKLSGEKT